MSKDEDDPKTPSELASAAARGASVGPVKTIGHPPVDLEPAEHAALERFDARRRALAQARWRLPDSFGPLAEAIVRTRAQEGEWP